MGRHSSPRRSAAAVAAEMESVIALVAARGEVLADEVEFVTGLSERHAREALRRAVRLGRLAVVRKLYEPLGRQMNFYRVAGRVAPPAPFKPREPDARRLALPRKPAPFRKLRTPLGGQPLVPRPGSLEGATTVQIGLGRR